MGNLYLFMEQELALGKTQSYMQSDRVGWLPVTQNPHIFVQIAIFESYRQFEKQFLYCKNLRHYWALTEKWDFW